MVLSLSHLALGLRLRLCVMKNEWGGGAAAAAAADDAIFCRSFVVNFPMRFASGPIHSFYEWLGNLRRNQRVSKLKKKEMYWSEVIMTWAAWAMTLVTWQNNIKNRECIWRHWKSEFQFWNLILKYSRNPHKPSNDSPSLSVVRPWALRSRVFDPWLLIARGGTLPNALTWLKLQKG